MSSIFEIHSLLIGEVNDIHHADNQLRKAVHKFAETASCNYLNTAFRAHFVQTRNYLLRLDAAIKLLGISETANSDCEDATVLEARGHRGLASSSLVSFDQPLELPCCR
jgi:ferritin-like metal-binding protein YciE